jgi:nucleotide-binding universal stress UspA family protein
MENSMYKKILITLDGTATDRAIIEHIKQLAVVMRSEVTLLHVADGWAARQFGADAVSPEIREDSEYLDKVRVEFESASISVRSELAFGNPADEIIRWIHEKGCDLVAMSTHGHRLVDDLLRGTTVTKVRHNVSVPVLLVRAK